MLLIQKTMQKQYCTIIFRDALKLLNPSGLMKIFHNFKCFSLSIFQICIYCKIRRIGHIRMNLRPPTNMSAGQRSFNLQQLYARFRASIQPLAALCAIWSVHFLNFFLISFSQFQIFSKLTLTNMTLNPKKILHITAFMYLIASECAVGT